MAPKTPSKGAADRPYSLSDAELMVSLHVLKLLATNTDSKVDKVELAKLTGHNNPSSALRIWFNAKKKMDATHGNGVAPARAAGNRGSPAGAGAGASKPVGKKRVRALPAEAQEGGDDSEESPTKRAKNQDGGKDDAI